MCRFVGRIIINTRIMKKILSVIFALMILPLLFSTSASAVVIESENFVYDDQGILNQFFKRDINIIGQKKYDEENIKCLLVIPKKPAVGEVDLQTTADQWLQATGHGPYESVLVIAYSDTQFAVAYSKYLQPRNVKDHLKHASELVYHAPYGSKAGMRIMEAYNYLTINLSMNHAYVYDAPNPMRDVERARLHAIEGSIACVLVVFLIWNVIMRWNMAIKIVVYLASEALIVASSVMMINANLDISMASIELVVLSIANIIVVFSEYVGLAGKIWPKLSERLIEKED